MRCICEPARSLASEDGAAVSQYIRVSALCLIAS
jgi:hypothetical protein